MAVLYTDPVNGGRARTLFEGVMRQRLERHGSGVAFALAAVEEETAVARGSGWEIACLGHGGLLA